MTVTEHQEHARTEEALEELASWGRNPNSDGGENIAFSVSRQGAPSDAFLAIGDCTPFTPQGSRGVLNGQPPGGTGAPVAYFIDFGIPLSVNQVACTFSFDLNRDTSSLCSTWQRHSLNPPQRDRPLVPRRPLLFPALPASATGALRQSAPMRCLAQTALASRSGRAMIQRQKFSLKEEQWRKPAQMTS